MNCPLVEPCLYDNGFHHRRVFFCFSFPGYDPQLALTFKLRLFLPRVVGRFAIYFTEHVFGVRWTGGSDDWGSRDWERGHPVNPATTTTTTTTTTEIATLDDQPAVTMNERLAAVVTVAVSGSQQQQRQQQEKSEQQERSEHQQPEQCQPQQDGEENASPATAEEHDYSGPTSIHG